MLGLGPRAAKGFIAAAIIALAVLTAVWWRAPTAAPTVTVTTLHGERVALSELRGKVVLVNFWATDCSVCLEEMPAMVQTWQSYHARGLEAIFIAMPYDRPDRVLNYARSTGLPFKVALDIRGEAARAFGGIQGTPTTFVIDKHGRIVERILGEPDFSRLHGLIERKLDEHV